MIQNNINHHGSLKKSQIECRMLIQEAIHFVPTANQSTIISNQNQISHDQHRNQIQQANKIQSDPQQSEEIIGNQHDILPNQDQNITRNHQSTLKIKTGRFSQQQQDILFRSICQWSNERDMDFKQFNDLIVLGKSKFYRMWNQICKVLPERRILSCYRFIKNRINVNGRKGKWSQQQVETLKMLVNKHGRNWSFIALKLGRTPQNIKDKYRAMGEDHHQKRDIQFWSFAELVALILFVREQTNTDFFQSELINQLDQAQYHDNISRQELKNRKRSSFDFQFHNMHVIRKYLKIQDIRVIEGMTYKWSELARQMESKSYDDCKNKWRSIVNWVYKFSDYSLKEDLNFLNQIINSPNPKLTHNRISEVIENNRSLRQNQIHWDILRKKVKNSGKQTPNQVAIQIKLMLQKIQNF